MRNPYFENLGSGVALLKDSEYRNMLLDQTPFSIRALKSDCDEVHRYSDGVYIHVSPVWSGVNLLFLLSLSLVAGAWTERKKMYHGGSFLKLADDNMDIQNPEAQNRELSGF